MLAIILGNTYVVAELDMEATLREVADPEVRAEIQAIKPTKCLMYLDIVRTQSSPSLHSIFMHLIWYIAPASVP